MRLGEDVWRFRCGAIQPSKEALANTNAGYDRPWGAVGHGCKAGFDKPICRERLVAGTLGRRLLKTGRGIENDRRYALALADTEFDEDSPIPLPKTKFLMLARHARLIALQSRYDSTSAVLTLRNEDRLLCAGALDQPGGRSEVETAIAKFMGSEIDGRPRLVQAQGHRFTDVSVTSPQMMEAVSLVNLASVRALEAALGLAIDPRRFRANLLVDGLAPWAEFGWLDRIVRIGGVAFQGARRTQRCAATEVNPDTGERDIRVPIELHEHFGHSDMGVYLYVRSEGEITPGDRLAPPDGENRQ